MMLAQGSLAGKFRSPDGATGAVIAGTGCEPEHFGTILPSMEGRRDVPRYLYGGTGELHLSHAPSKLEIIIMSISVNGCRIEGSQLPDAGQHCEVRFNWQGMEFKAKGEIAWKGKDGTAGLRFSKVNEDSRETLLELCANLRLEPLGPRPAHF
jgi:hypothetical protein